jgi:hypothetical protein
MATVSNPHTMSGSQERAGDPAKRRLAMLLHDDYVAGRNVSAILISIVFAAMIAGMGAVAWIACVAR